MQLELAVARGQAVAAAGVAADGAHRQGDEAAVREARAGALQGHVGERPPEPLGMLAERRDAVQRARRQRILVVQVGRAELQEGTRVAARPGGLPGIGKPTDDQINPGHRGPCWQTRGSGARQDPGDRRAVDI